MAEARFDTRDGLTEVGIRQTAHIIGNRTTEGNMDRLGGKVAVITGAARGIGRAIAERFIEEGARVVLADIDGDELASTAAALNSSYRVCDVSKKSEIAGLVQFTISQHRQIDIAVNNAGIIHTANLLELEEADFDRVIGINLKGALFLTQLAAEQMIPRRTGAIINMSSVNAVLAIPNQIPYAVSKGALNQLTKVTSLSLAPYGIRVNAIGPGTIDTAIAAAVISDKAAEQRVMSRTPLGRRGTVHEVASVAAFLASEDSSYMTGQTLYPDGGRLGLNYTV